MEQMMANMPPTYIPNKIKMALRARKEKAYQKRMRNKYRGIRGKVQNNTKNIISEENKILRKVKYAYEDAAREHIKHKKKMKRQKKKETKMKKQMSRLLKFGEKYQNKLKELQSNEDESLMKTFDNLQNDNAYYGVEAKAPTPEVIDSNNLSTEDLVNQKIVPERILAKKRKGKKKQKKKTKKKKML